MTPRQSEPRMVEAGPGQGWPLGSGRRRPGHLTGRVNTAAPGYRRHPPRSGLAHVERGNPVPVRTCWSGGPTVRKADLRAGTGWPKKPMPVAERQQETESRSAAFFRAAGPG